MVRKMLAPILVPCLAFDEAVLLALLRFRPPALTLVMRGLTKVGDGSSWVLTSVALLCAGGAAAVVGLRVGIAAGIAAAISQALKHICRRARPTSGIDGFTALMENPDAFSFPSGHAAAAFAVALALAGAVPGGGAFLVLAFGVALSRVFLGALDVMAGAVLGILSGAVARGVLA